jgi:hypothetical protein
MQADGSVKVPVDTAEAVFEQAFATWANVDCGAGGPGVVVTKGDRVACAEVEYNQPPTTGNANVIVFRDTKWPHQGQGNTLALTTVTYNLDTGEIYDADMELNGTTALTTGDANVEFDLLSIATHEAGHFLGLAHSANKNATMYVEYLQGTTELRSLEEDDRSAICAAYPTDSAGPCDPTPRHGFSSECGTVPDEGCACTVLGRPATRSPAPWVALALCIARRTRR